MLLTIAQSIRRAAGRHKGVVLLAGLAIVSWHNWRLWRRDRALADRLRTQRAPLPELSRTPRVSALVAAWNESANIDAHIQSFLALEYPEIELVLCAGGIDDTLERARRYASVRVIVLEQQPGEGKQRALAHCMGQASGELIYLTDADCVHSTEALLQLIHAVVADREQVATGTLRPLDKQLDKLLPHYLWASDVVSSTHRSSYSDGLLGMNALIVRQALEQAGGFNYSARTGTDYQLARRLINAGNKIRFVPASVVPTEYPESISAHRHRQSRWLRNLLIYGPKYKVKHDFFVTLKTVAIGALMLLTPLTFFWTRSSIFYLWLFAFIHAICSKLRYILFTARMHRRPTAWHVVMFLIPLTLIDFGVWALPILDLLNAKRRQQW